MTVYKLSVRIMRGNIGAMLLFLSIFLGISLLASTTAGDTTEQIFSQAKVPIAFFPGESTPLVQGLEQELKKVSNFLSYEDDYETLLEALFYGRIQYIVRIPQGFTEDFYAGFHPQVQTFAGPNEGRSMYIDMAIDNYLNTLSLYQTFLPEMSESNSIRSTQNDLNSTTSVNILQESRTGEMLVDTSEQYFNYLIFFNYQAYSLFAILILGISTNLIVFNSRLIRMRLNCSPLGSKQQSIQLFLANFIFALVCWFIMNGVSLLFVPKLIGTVHLGLFLLNSLLLTFWASCISFFIAHLVKNKNTVSAITNIVAMGSSFLAGVFVPQEFLGESVLRAASFTPTYWFVLANTHITRVGGSIRTFASLTEQNQLWTSFAMQLAFGITFLALTMVVRKKQALSSS